MATSFYDNIRDAQNGIGGMLDRQVSGTGIYITEQKKHQYIKKHLDWVILFDFNLDRLIINGSLSGRELQIFMYLKSSMKFGNKIIEKRSDIAKLFNMRPNNVSRSMKKLERSKTIIKMNGDWYINPHICIRCNSYSPDDELRKLIDISTKLIKNTVIIEAVTYIPDKYENDFYDVVDR